ncbi:F-box only protein 47-like [Anguilla anguilla]|uniref:F-box only protein 47-like n=1 Tax=Anguilla anguilla TaxID=7936 RepID=UPI0015ACBD0A|nr:F-box only protein 47-like [Anguilla anguilla]XP_035250577.1 F-box only protein 47-like [Anguilla anguilla]
MESISENFTMTHKYHRSCKAQHYASRTVSTRSQCRTMQGFFERLPAEVLDMVLECLSVMDISVFSMVSKAINSYITGYVSTQAWRNRMIMLKFHHSASPTQEDCILDHYRSLGVLFKRCTLLLPTKDRLKFIYSKFSQVPCFTMERCTSSPGCLGFASYGVFLQTLIAGWDELECHRVFNFLCEFTNLPRKIETIVNGKPGACHKLELQIRLFCRNVLLDPWQNRRDTLFWLTRILKLWPMVSQARLLFVLYGPLLPDGKIGWHEMLDGVVAQCGLWDLAKAVILLYTDAEAKDWSADTLLGIIEEMTVVPEAWHMENMARLLVLCGNSICYSVLASRAVNRRFLEISRLIVFLILVCEKDGFCMSWPVKMMQQICKVFPTSEDKWSFVKGVESMLSEVAMEMYEVIMAGERNKELDTFQSLCNLLNASSHFHTEMVYMFLKKD